MVYNNHTLALKLITKRSQFWPMVRTLSAKDKYVHEGVVYLRDNVSSEWKQIN